MSPDVAAVIVTGLIMLGFIAFVIWLVMNPPLPQKPPVEGPGSPLPAEPPAGCSRDIGVFLQTQLNGLVTYLNAALMAAPNLVIIANTPIGKLDIEGGKVQFTAPDPREPTVIIRVDPNSSYLCGPESTTPGFVQLTGTIQLSTSPLSITPPSPLVGAYFQIFNIMGTASIALIPSGSTYKLQSIAVSNLRVSGVALRDPRYPFNTQEYVNGFAAILNGLSTAVLVPTINKYLRDALMAQTDTTLAVFPNANESEETKAMKAFVLTQVNALLGSPIVQSAQFCVQGNLVKVDGRPASCVKGTPPVPAGVEPSVLNNVQLGTAATSADDGCAGVVFPFGIGCVGCSWGYVAAVNSIQGLGSLKITDVNIGAGTLTTPTTFYLDATATATASNARVYGTLHVQACTPIANIRILDNEPMPLTASPTATFTLQLVGTRDPTTGLTTFAVKDIKIRAISLSITVAIDSLFTRILSILAGPIINLIAYGVNLAVNTALGYFKNQLGSLFVPLLQGLLKDRTESITIPIAPPP